MKKYYPTLSPAVFDMCIALDPTYDVHKDRAGTYGKWILGLAVRNGGQIPDEGHIEDSLVRFEENKANLKNKDIGQFKTVAELDAYLDNPDSYKDLSKRQQLRQVQKAVHNTDISKDAELVFEDSDWQV